jgi:Helix-turn-helix domain
MARSSRGHIQCLPSGSFRVKVYAGTDPVTGKERLLRQTCPDEAAAHVALGRLLAEADGGRFPDRDAPLGQAHVIEAHPPAPSTDSQRTYTTVVWDTGTEYSVSPARHQVPAAPPGLWDRAEMAKALSERDIGAVIGIYRKWTGASQTDIGMLVGIPQPHISGIEHGKRLVTSLDLFERFADGLGIPRHLLGLAETTTGQPGAAGSGGVNYRADASVSNIWPDQ